MTMLRVLNNWRGYPVSAKSDDELVREAQAGSEEAFSLLVSRYRNKLIQFLKKKVKNHALAEDLAQDTLLSVYLNIKEFRFESEFYTWVCTIGIRKVYKLKPEPKGQEVEWSTDYTPERHLELKEELSQATEFIKNLPKMQQKALVMRECSELTYDEISAILQCTKGNALNLVSLAKKSLRKELDEKRG